MNSRGNNSAVALLAMLSEGKWIVAGSQGDTSKVWDLAGSKYAISAFYAGRRWRSTVCY